MNFALLATPIGTVLVWVEESVELLPGLSINDARPMCVFADGYVPGNN